MSSAARSGHSTTAPALLEIRSVSKSFGSRPVLRSISLGVASGEFLTILGESGSGKTTLLRVIAGLEQLDSGEILMAGERLDVLPPFRRRVNTVFQSYALFPHLSVFENIAYGLRIQDAAKSDIDTRVREALEMVKMEEYVHSSPAKLSGGQQQRVALARALVNRPQILLLDEPLSALDANLRRQMQLELKSLQREVGITFLFVTHDQEEAMALSDRIALLRAGQIEQIGSPREIYNCPATAYTALFVGQTNLLRCEVRNKLAAFGKLSWPAAVPDGPAIFSLRPECIRISSAGSRAGGGNGTVRFRARLLSQTFAGATDLLQIQSEDGGILRVRIPSHQITDGLAEFEFFASDAVCVRDSEKS
ncbi:MAG TPA: ABC transporter ATP-binding protein [Candidatus Acidoferrales bacterium]|nr:ABC transporter ATP-binding protein [Candidatus Acidoferrales bacterium]